MNESLHTSASIYIDNQKIDYLKTATINISGGARVSDLSATISTTLFDESSLFGKPVVFYLDSGDGAPIFRGYVKTASSSKNNFKISAVDVRGYITSESSKKVHLTDIKNYDGYSLGAFLKEYIDNEININKILIGTDKINDTNPLISLSGVRGTFSPYELVTQRMANAIDENNDLHPLGYNITTIDDGVNSHIKFIKQKLPDSPPSLSFSEFDGIISYSYRKRPKKFIATLSDGKTFQYGSAPIGPFSMGLSGAFTSPDEERENARLKILQNLEKFIEITLEVTKGHYLGIEDIVYVNVSNGLINGAHKVVSKTINYGDSLKCSLKLSKLPASIEQYF
tara:strand:- start:88 stop:1104 length:1017 start_codon:yes stop_codon:yes gene_type:complete